MNTINLETIHELTTKEEVFEFFYRNELLQRLKYCEACNMPLHLVKYKKNIDNRAFKCNKSSCILFQKYINVRKNSFFEKYKIDLKKILYIMYSWFKNENISQVVLDYNISKSFVLKLYNDLREKTMNFFLKNEYKLGGVNKTVQIDESMFRYKQKYHVGRFNCDYRWVFGIVEISGLQSKYYVELVQNRKAETLLPLILSRVKANSIVWSDEWRAYKNLSKLNFCHETVNHSVNFVNPLNGTHTQNVESLWNKLKKRIKKENGCSVNSLNNKLREWMWLDNICKNDFSRVYDLINN